MLPGGSMTRRNGIDDLLRNGLVNRSLTLDDIVNGRVREGLVVYDVESRVRGMVCEPGVVSGGKYVHVLTKKKPKDEGPPIVHEVWQTKKARVLL